MSVPIDDETKKIIEKLKEQNIIQDKTVRDKQSKAQEYVQEQAMAEYQKEEEDMQKYVDQLKQPVNQDPTKVKKQDIKYASSLNLFKTQIKYFLPSEIKWSLSEENVQRTPEEVETVRTCASHVFKNVLIYGLFFTGVTTFMNFKVKKSVSLSYKLLGIPVGFTMGFCLAMTQQKEYIMRRFEELGPQFQLGRNVIQEINDNRLDEGYIKK